MDLSPLALSLQVALLATSLAGVVGIAIATLLARRAFPGASCSTC